MLRPVAHFSLAILLSFLSAHLFAQIGGGSIVGYVNDASSASVAGADVVAVNAGTNTRTETKTNSQGYFEFPLLAPGRYRIEAAAAGFQQIASEEFTLNTGSRPRFDLKLGITQQVESIQVSATAPIVNATTTDTGVVIDRNKVDNLPLNGRDFQNWWVCRQGFKRIRPAPWAHEAAWSLTDRPHSAIT